MMLIKPMVYVLV
ncbi:UNVERIFIED_CONTAM: hypothetical protein GTU68_047661 [Idotea baltica]|nr:hypothetical protein [Idotea baltica]